MSSWENEFRLFWYSLSKVLRNVSPAFGLDGEFIWDSVGFRPVWDLVAATDVGAGALWGSGTVLESDSHRDGGCVGP